MKCPRCNLEMKQCATIFLDEKSRWYCLKCKNVLVFKAMENITMKFWKAMDAMRAGKEVYRLDWEGGARMRIGMKYFEYTDKPGDRDWERIELTPDDIAAEDWVIL